MVEYHDQRYHAPHGMDTRAMRHGIVHTCDLEALT
jgi:hypothetical protein